MSDESTWELLRLLFTPHPWHAVEIGEDAPEEVSAYIEIVPVDTVKYELDKASGFLRVDRPQKYSSVCPTLYGFLPQTYCGERVAALCREKVGRGGILGDGDPLDICVLTERSFSHGDFFLSSRPIGGFRMLDGDTADDKILAVLEGDAAFGSWRDVAEMPEPQLERLRHYFLTYKQPPHPAPRRVEITHVYGRREAHEVIERSRADYAERFPRLKARLLEALASPGETL